MSIDLPGLKLSERLLVKLNNGNIEQEKIIVSFKWDKNLSDDELEVLTERYENIFSYQFVNENAENERDKFRPFVCISASDFENLDERFLLLNADDNMTMISEICDIVKVKNIIFSIRDFKDGRAFSLIRQIRQVNKIAEIFIAGNYGLDQANYYLKSGATGFFVKDEQLDTLLKTLNDLKSGHFGNSVNKLPMFQ